MRGDSLRIEDDSLVDSSLANDSKLNDSVANSRFRRKKTLKDYEFVINENSRFQTSELGKGAYGTVKKVRDLDNGKIYAMKIMNKKAIFEYSNKENLKREITIQKSMFHPHIIRLYTYFEDTENVYLILEFAENGSLFHYLRKRKTLSEKEAFIFFFQTCLGIDYLHQKKVIHRDLKPENLLLDSEGNIKLCDFGWSVDTHSNRHTFCGTIDYMAPEMIKNLPHDQRLDIWCLGILLFEMLHGHAPFKGRTEQEKTRNISMNSQIKFDTRLSSQAVDLIQKILKPAPSDRISLMEIFQHSWMKHHEQLFDINVMSYVEQQNAHIVKESSRPPRRKDKENTPVKQESKGTSPNVQNEIHLKPASPPNFMRKNLYDETRSLTVSSEKRPLSEKKTNLRDGLQVGKRVFSEKIYVENDYQDLNYKEREKSDRIDTLQSLQSVQRTVETPQFSMDNKSRSITSDNRLKQENPHVVQRIDYRRECSFGTFGTEESQLDGYNHYSYPKSRNDSMSLIRQSIEEEDESFDDFIKRIRSQSQPKPPHASHSVGPSNTRQAPKDLNYTNPFRSASDSQFKKDALNRKATAKFGSELESRERSFTEEKREVHDDLKMRKERVEIEPRKRSKKPQKELGFFESILVSIGCIARDEEKSPREYYRGRKGKKNSAFCLS